MFLKKKNIIIFLIVLFVFSVFYCINVNASSVPIAVIGMNPQQNITTETVVNFDADASTPSDGAVITATSWGGDYSFDGKYTAGEHTVTLVVQDSAGLTSAPESITFNVTDPNTATPPVAVITMTPDTNITNMTYVEWSYENSTSYDGYFSDFEWSNAMRQYPVGVHTVKLRVKDNLGVWSEWAEKTFTVSQEGSQTQIPTGNRYVESITENTGTSLFEIHEEKEFDLSELSFTVRYGDDTTKTISPYYTDITIEDRYRDIGYISADKVLHLYHDVEYNDYIVVNFSYTERNKTVRTGIRFTYRRSNNIGLISSMTTNVSEIQVPRDEVFYLKDILFKVMYENGYQEYLDGTKVDTYFSPEFKSLFYIDDTDIQLGTKVTPMINAVPGTSAIVEFSLQSDAFYTDPTSSIPIKTFKKYIKFVVIDEDEEYITENSIEYISCTDTVVGISDNEKLDINSLDFVAHLYSGQLRKIHPSTMVLNMQYKYKQNIIYDETNGTLMFKPETPYGTEIILNFVYNKIGGTKYVDVKVIYVEGSPNYGSEITPLFTDISGHWAQNDIIQMSLKNMAVGYVGSLYYPDRPVTRAEVANFISKYLELDKKDIDLTVNHFTDVINQDFSYSDIEKVYMAGVFQGYGDGTFLPDALITRQELALVLYRTYQYKTGLALSGNNAIPFIDDGAISYWARDAVYSARAIGIIHGREDGKFYPYDYTTRAEITAMLNRMLTK